MYKKQNAFTLMEILVVTMIVGIMAGLGIVNHAKAIERAKMKQAFYILQSFRDAERAYYRAEGSYIGCSTIADCRSSLDLELPFDGNDDEWAVRIFPTGTTARVRIQRVGGPYSGCQYSLNLNANATIWQSTGVACP